MKKTTGLIAVIAILLFSAIGISAAENYAYTVNDVYFTDLEDNRLNGYTDGCMVNVDVTKNLSTNTKDIIVLSVYDSDNKFSGLYLMKGTINQGEERSFGMSFSMPSGVETGKIKAFVVSSLSSMTPLSGVTSIDVTGAVISELDTFVTLPAGSIEEFAEHPPCIRAYPTEDSELTSYYLSNNFSLYVNGVQQEIDQSIIDKYFFDSEYEITLVDKYPADGKYDEVRTEYYYTGMVEGVSRNKIYFEDGNIACATEDAEVYITHNGEKKDISYIEPGDVLTVQYDILGHISDSPFYNIIISRETAEGTLEFFNDTKETVTLSGKEYETVDYPIIRGDESIKIGDDYKLYLDYKGRIFKSECLSANTNYAIIDKYAKSSSDDYYRATLILPSGEQITPEVDTTKTHLSDIDLLNITYSNGSDKNPVSRRVVEYKLSADESKVISINSAEPEFYADNHASYSAASKSIDAILISDKTKIIKADDSYSPTIVEPMSASNLEDGARYEAYAYGETLSDGSYPFIMIVAWELWTQSQNTRFAVVDDYTGSGINGEGDNIYSLTVMCKQDGEDSASIHALIINEDAYVNGKIIDESTYFDKGDIIIFHEDKKGNIDEIFTLASADRFGFSDCYSTTAYNAFSNSPISSLNLPGEWSTDISRAKYENHVIAYGPILSKSSTSFRMAIPTKINFDGTDYIATDLTNTNTFVDVRTNSDTVVYVWDFAKQPRNRLMKTEGTIQPSIIPSAYKLNNGKFIPFAQSDGTPISETTSCLNFAFVRIANGYAKEVFMFLAP